jgi:GAF domain-containing protein
MQRVDPDTMLAGLSKLAAAQAEIKDRTELLDVAASTAGTIIGHKLFTVMAFHERTMEVERLYSNQPDAYPTGGRKKKRDTEWGRQVLERGKPYVGRSADDIRKHFNDHDVILGLGLEAILNMPIRLGGKTIGTMNLLHEADYYSKSDISSAQLIAGLVAGRFA